MSPFQGGNIKEAKQLDSAKKKGKGKRQSVAASENDDEEEMDTENMDWWSKYHASMETMIRVRNLFHINNISSISYNICYL